MNGRPPIYPPGYDPLAAARRRKAATVRHYQAKRDPQPDIYVTPFTTTYPNGETVESWAVVSESRSGDPCGIWHFPTKAEAVDAALAMGIAAP
jgi:hypothetical protein